MRKTFDRRVVSESVLEFVRSCQVRIPCHLGGGAALAGAYLGHRMTGDIDLFVHEAAEMRALVDWLPALAKSGGISVTLLRDVGHLVRARLSGPDGRPTGRERAAVTVGAKRNKAGREACLENFLVAGAGFEPATFGL